MPSNLILVKLTKKSTHIRIWWYVWWQKRLKPDAVPTIFLKSMLTAVLQVVAHYPKERAEIVKNITINCA